MNIQLYAKNLIENPYSKQLIEKVNEKTVMLNNIAALENNMNAIMDEFNKSRDEINDLSTKLSVFSGKENNYRFIIEDLASWNKQLNEKLDNLEVNRRDDCNINCMIEHVSVKVEPFDADRSAVIQEEFDTLSQTLNYNINDLQEKRRLLDEAQLQVE